MTIRLYRKKKRPISRTVSSLRDDRLYILACDDTYAPKQYFSFFALPRIQVHVVQTADGSSHASHVLDRLLQIEHQEQDERWLLLDTDHCIEANHIGRFLEQLKRANDNGVKVALSRPCFEVWLLLHHLKPDELSDVVTAADAEVRLRTVLGSFNKCNLRQTDFPLSSVRTAIERAEVLDSRSADKLIPEGTSTRVHRVWRSILSSATSNQLPEELRID